MCVQNQRGLEERNVTQQQEWGERWKEEGWRGKKHIWNPLEPLFLHCPFWSQSTPVPLHLFPVISFVFYNSWCLVLRELLRVVTVLEVSSISSPSFNSSTSLKNLKTELKLIQEVSSCLSVPTWKKTHGHRETNIRVSELHKTLLELHVLCTDRGRAKSESKWAPLVTMFMDIRLPTPPMHCSARCRAEDLCMRAMTTSDLFVQWDSLNMLSSWIPDQTSACPSFHLRPSYKTSHAQWAH